jgi:DNA repair protein RadC
MLKMKLANELGRGKTDRVILAHNHPSGVCEASQADIRITERLQKALALVDIRVLDHVIVGDGITCLSEQGLV